MAATPTPLANSRLGKVPQTFLNFAFIFALALAGVSLLFSAFYLFSFAGRVNAGIQPIAGSLQTQPGATEVYINGTLVMARLSLLSCGVSVGISFGFLGFALTLLGVKQSIDVGVETETAKAKFARMSPGVLVILCSVVLVGFCSTRETPFWYEKTVDLKPSQTIEDSGSNTKNSPLNGDMPAPSKEFSTSPNKQ